MIFGRRLVGAPVTSNVRTQLAVVKIRCTQKLLRRLSLAASIAGPTTRLGDWYANILFARPEQLILCVSERSLLSVVVPARPAAALPMRLARSLGEVLARLDVAPVLMLTSSA